ncbi:hypothetical protein F2Q70_00030258 [Brassica cretica]|uniref:Uncharacterized protein n=1 Tax=Brassica cretica TaxID=69181 RepID=A0A8S9FSC2_BRACR|nr:hypothetical protein F2Q70_00030258 [Brassica cretica]KAF2551529.1 hypothetical protein F2Q68_00034724 [Brassica cretica]
MTTLKKRESNTDDVDGAVAAFPYRSSSVPSPPTTSEPVMEGEKREVVHYLNGSRELESSQLWSSRRRTEISAQLATTANNSSLVCSD